MSGEKRRRLIGLFMAVLVIAATFNPQAKSFFALPAQQRVLVGEDIRLDLRFPESLLRQLSMYVEPGTKRVLVLNGTDVSGRVFGFTDGWLSAAQPGKANIQIRLFGVLPIKNVKVEVLPQTRVIPGGQSVGVLLHSEGVIVVGQSIVQDQSGRKFNPALEAGIEVGDVIIKINGQAVTGDEQAARIIDQAGRSGQALQMTVKRRGKVFSAAVKPIMCRETGRYRIGLYIRDSAAGVGTLSFYDPVSGKYGALGHIITDSDTNQPIDVSDGRVVRAAIQGIQAGKKGLPGEKIGMFIHDGSFSGNIEKNTRFGIYGTLNTPPQSPFYKQPIPIALADQVTTGPAEMLTVLDGEKIERFQVQIRRILPQTVPDSKGMVIEITDPRLLRRTGGIIQGMSGSPLIQNGKLIGAVTHVFINDPTRGYGCLIEWMLREAGSGVKKTKQLGSFSGSRLT